MKFEIHITGDERIHNYGLKTIKVDLLKPDLSLLRTEHMTSMEVNFDNYSDCLFYSADLRRLLNKNGLKIYRTKIECYPDRELLKHAIYIETHIDHAYPQRENGKFPISRLNDFIITDRQYKKDCFELFADTYDDYPVELCLYDDNIESDKDWFGLYNLCQH